jgi:hypothetical protein
MSDGYRLGPWILDNWSRMALPFAVLTLCSLPVFLAGGNLPLVLLYTSLPVYMIHQYEEHAHGRFVEFFNSTIGGGRRVLTKVSAFWINILGVWLLFLASFYLAKYVALGLAFVPVYLVLVNAATHVLTSVRLRTYNPGLYTSVLLFLPWGTFLAVYFSGIVRASLLFNAIGLLLALAEHAAIALYAISSRRKLEVGSR